MQLKTHDNYQNERLQLLMEAVSNSLLEGELCPNCFEQYSSNESRKIANAALKSTESDPKLKGPLREVIAQMKALKEESVLTIKDSSDDLIREYHCKRCQRSYVGELNLIGNLSETQVLAFFGHDDTRSYKKDFYSFSLIDDSYNSFVKELWEEEVDPSIQAATLTPRFILETPEDSISGEVLKMLKDFFVKFSKAVHSDIGSEVGVYSYYHAGTVEAGRRKGVAASGADAAIWIGPMTKEDMKAVSDYVNLSNAELPVLVGNGVILQAKKENGGNVERKQIEDLIKYASIEYKGHEYLGVPGKLFMNFSIKPPFVTVLSCDFTYQLYLHSKQLPENQKSVSFGMSLNKFAEHIRPIELPEFVESYLAGKIGTPLLMLQDIFATPGPKLIVGLPPELLENPRANQQSPLGAAVDRLIEAVGERLEAIEQSEMTYAEPEQYYAEHLQEIKLEQTQYAPSEDEAYQQEEEIEHAEHVAARLRYHEEAQPRQECEQQEEEKEVIREQVRYM